ncbi:MAG: DUF1566 domain-containing protein, partial [Alphaproteobacteria bacterium]|nr:DUF1566 domain-containing protein [Alphaproteobacteria bacterium]
TMCQDSTIYMGLSPDGNVKMYATACDMGFTWNGSICAGARQETSWNDGGPYGNDIVTGFTHEISGSSNTAGLVAFGNGPSPAPYRAALWCHNLTVHGHSDWYLPARLELAVLFQTKNIPGSGLSGDTYWSSTETSGNTSYARCKQFSDGFEKSCLKSNTQAVRCVRK